MASYETLSIIQNMNPDNFIDIRYDSENREYIAYFKNADIKLPDRCYTAHCRIYDGIEDKKVCKIELK